MNYNVEEVLKKISSRPTQWNHRNFKDFLKMTNQNPAKKALKKIINKEENNESILFYLKFI